MRNLPHGFGVYQVNLGLKGGFQLIQILGFFGMYFDAVVVEDFFILFRLALTILCVVCRHNLKILAIVSLQENPCLLRA